MRRIDAESLALIKRWEGLRLSAYQCAAGVWTIGYGHTAGVKPGDTITEDEALRLLLADLRAAEETVERLVHVPLTDNRFGALTSFVFNVGQDAFARSTLLRKLNAGDYEAVSGELARWTRAGGRVVQGLVNRRAAESGLWVRGAFVASGHVGAAPVRVPAGPTVGAAGGVLATGVIATLAEHAGALTPLVAALRDIHPAVALGLIGVVAGAALIFWRSAGRA